MKSHFKPCILAVFIICAVNISVVPVNAKSREADEDDVCEVVFRHMMAPQQGEKDEAKTNSKEPVLINGKEIKVPPFKVFFLSIDNEKDPSDAFMKRFLRHKPSVKKVSQSKHDPKPIPEYDIDLQEAHAMYAIRDKTTGALGQILNVAEIKWIRRNRVSVGSSYVSGGLSAVGYISSVIRVKGKWRVENRKMTWVS